MTGHQKAGARLAQVSSAGNAMDLFVLNGCTPGLAVVVAHRGPDIAIAQIDLTDPKLKTFTDFVKRVEGVLVHGDERPTAAELDALGVQLFDHIFSGDVRRLYDRLPSGRVSIQIITDAPVISRVPWEYLRPVDRQPVPHRERCVVRVLPMCAPTDVKPPKKLKKLRVLLAVADPVDQRGVRWADVEASLQRVFSSQTDVVATLKVVPGANRTSLLKALESERFDVFHFLGHGGLVNGQGNLFLVNIATGATDSVSADDVAIALAGQNLKLCILSACLTGASTAKDDFAPVATALVRAGIPAVVANQTSIPTKSVAPFVGALYARLLRDGNIDSAVMAGRVALQFELRQTIAAKDAVVEWGIPTLYRLPGDGQIFARAGGGE
jgi:hypothetical protein